MDLGRVDPRDWVRQQFGAPPRRPAQLTLVAPATPLDDGQTVATRVFVSHDEDGLELHVDANGVFADRGVSWVFAVAVIEARRGHS